MAGETLLTNAKVTSSAEDTSKLAASSEVVATIKEQTNIINNDGKRIFRNAIPMSSFIFPSGKVVYFRGGVYGTDKPEEIEDEEDWGDEVEEDWDDEVEEDWEEEEEDWDEED